MSRVLRGLCFALVAICLSGPVHAQKKKVEKKSLTPDQIAAFDAAFQDSRGVLAASDKLYEEMMIAQGELNAGLAHLDARLADEKLDDAGRAKVLRLKARFLRRFGDVQPALEAMNAIPEKARNHRDLMSRAEVLDAAGKNTEALELYGKLVDLVPDPEAKKRLLLRAALLREKDQKAEKSPLAVFAADDQLDADIRNQAAMILALRDEQKAAVEVYAIRGEKTKLFRQLIRLSEWALEAKDWPAAQSFAWRAVRSSELKRDRRYALTILVEAYRRAKKLDDLITKFGQEKDLDDESRKTWIDLLRETGRIDEALELFRASADGAFTVDMRRELLDMCRETGRDETLVSAYQQLIDEEPRFVEWRQGLSRFHLERGNRDAAEKVWIGYREAVDHDESRVMLAADVLGTLGLDELAERFATEGFDDPNELARSRIFLFELHFGRGRLEKAEAELEKLDALAGPGSDVRMDLAGAYERLGKKKRAVEILRGLSKERGDLVAGDMEMKLALLLSDIGEEEEALERWRSLWRKLESIPRRRYVEDRMMTVASRLGTLAKIAIDLEKRLADGQADSRESGLLVRLYTRVKDAVSATDVIEEYMKQTSGDPLKTLTEKSRVYLSCTDYFNYEETIEQLIKIDPENAPDYYRQLAMSRLERGKRMEARKILERLRGEEADSASDEFEAGVLALAGMREESMAAYRKAVARNSHRIDNYLLLSNVMKELGQFDRSAGMFQYLAETADRDDLFTIAIDGILNMRDGRQNAGAPDRLVKWARRITLERLARRPDKLYLYQLVADLSVELKDKDTAIRALKSALPIAGEQRTQLLRELMSMSQATNRSSGVMYVVINGQLVQQGGNDDSGGLDLKEQNLMFGRRLLGQGELVPPGVYLELGETFLKEKEVANASRTFNQASKLPDFASFQRKIAASFETARYEEEALRVYERILSVETSDLSLMTRVGELREKLGFLDVSRDLYLRALDLMFSKKPFEQSEKKEKGPDKNDPMAFFMRNRNVSETDKELPHLERGLLATLNTLDGKSLLKKLRSEIEADFPRIEEQGEKRKEMLSAYPRIAARSAMHRRLAVAFDELDKADGVDARLLELFEKDEKLLETMVRFRIEWGYNAAARRLIAKSGRPVKEQKRLSLLAGGEVDTGDAGLVTMSEAATLALPLIADGRSKEAKLLLERLDYGTGEKSDLEQLPTLVAVAAFLDASDSTLSLCRHWVNMAVKHEAGSLYVAVEGILKQGRMSLDTQQQQSLVQHLVSAMLEKPEKFNVMLSRLPDLQKSLGMQLLTTEQVEKIITTRLEASNRSIYGIPGLILMTPKEGHASMLRNVLSKVAKERKASFIFEFVGSLEEEVEDSVVDFLATNLAVSLKDVKDDFTIKYGSRSLTQSTENNLPLRMKLVDQLIEFKPDQSRLKLMKTGLLVKAGEVEEAFETAEKPLIEMLSIKQPDWEVAESIDETMRVLSETHFDRLVALLDEGEKKDPSPKIALRRILLLQEVKDADVVLAAMKKAVETYPKDVALRTRLRSRLSTLGRLREMIEVQEQIVGLKPKDNRAHSTLISDWRRAKNPIKALEATEANEKRLAAKSKETNEDNQKAPRARANARELKKAFDAGNDEEARRIFHELWRSFPNRNARYFSNFRSSLYLRSWQWPLDEAELKARAEKAKKDRKVSRGGLPDFGPLKKTEKKKDERKSVYEVMARTEYGAQEIERLIRALDSSSFTSPVVNQLLQIEAEKRIAEKGRQAAVNEVLAASEKGQAGRVDFGVLFALLEGVDAKADPEVRKSVDELIRVVNSRDSGQIRRLARLYAALGDTDKAALLWRWSVKVATQDRFSWGVPRELVEEIIECLDGDARNAVLAEIFRATQPSGEYAWGHDTHATQVLETWIEVVGADQAWKLCDETLKLVLDLRPEARRNAAKIAAGLAARQGEFELAKRYLEIALLKLEVPEGTDAWNRSDYERPGYLTRAQLRRLLPADTEGWVDPVAWLDVIAEALPGWLESKRIEAEKLFELQALLALRYFEAGRAEEADFWLTEVEKSKAASGQNQLWVADLARRFGDDERADRIEINLLSEGQLHLERLDEVVQAIAERDGKEAALAAGEKIGAWCHHPDLITTLISLAESLENDERAAHWMAVQEKAEAAREALKAKAEAKKKKA